MIPDGTLGGYLAKHSRPPAFEGSDGQSYSVDLYVSEDGETPGLMQGALLFVRWSADGSQPVGHLETEYLVAGRDPAEVKAQLHELPLLTVKEYLERTIRGGKEMPDW